MAREPRGSLGGPITAFSLKRWPRALICRKRLWYRSSSSRSSRCAARMSAAMETCQRRLSIAKPEAPGAAASPGPTHRGVARTPPRSRRPRLAPTRRWRSGCPRLVGPGTGSGGPRRLFRAGRQTGARSATPRRRPCASPPRGRDHCHSRMLQRVQEVARGLRGVSSSACRRSAASLPAPAGASSGDGQCGAVDLVFR